MGRPLLSTDRMSALGSGCRSGAADNAMTCGDGIVGGTIARAVGGRGVRGMSLTDQGGGGEGL